MVTKKGSLSMVAIGDVIVGQKNYQRSFAKVKNILKEADIAFFNNETAYATSGAVAGAQHGATTANPDKMPALADAGLDVCTLANNHTLDWGLDAVVECLDRLKKMGIAVCGAGKTYDEAHKPAILERNGVKVAFLGYCSTGPNEYGAEVDKPGAAMVRIHTHYEPYEYQPGTAAKIVTWAYREDLEKMIDDIKQAKKQADIVVMTDHWGIHHTPILIPDYDYEVGHAAIDAGADIVIGTHPHILKAIEVYNGKVILHSMANFVMEGRIAKREGETRRWSPKSWGDTEELVCGPRSPDDKKTIIAKILIENKKIARVSYIPVLMDQDDTHPEPLTQKDPRGQAVYKYIEDITRSVKLNTKFTWDGDEVVIET
jgi:poly-gamma-glutamate capsule biosynthesis protein CapA/YwtB (metallophosphatase superfamily)